MKNPNVTVIIPNWNGKKFLRTCLGSLSKQTYRDFEIIVVDNGSTDKSVDFLKQNYPQVKLISLPENMGFSYAVNRGMEQSKGKYIILLNNDTKVDAYWLEELHKALVENPEVGFCASKVLFMDKPKVINSAGDLYQKNGRARNIGLGETDAGQFEEPTTVFGTSGVAAMYRRELFEDVGLFDEDFFAFYEDVDLSFRAQLLGYCCLYVPTAVIYHVGGVTIGGDRSPRGAFFGQRNLINVLVKDMPGKLLIKYAPSILWYQVKTLGAFVFGIEYGFFSLKGKFVALGQLPRMLKKRCGIQRSRRVPVDYIESIITE